MNWTPREFDGAMESSSSQGFSQANFHFHCGPDFPSTQIDLSQQRKNDTDFITNFVLSNQKNMETNVETNTVKISDAKSLLLEIICDKKKIEKELLHLDVNDKSFDSKWEMLLVELKKLNEKILKFDSDVKIPLLIALRRRLKKRQAIKKRKEKLHELKKLQQQEIQEKHKIIDKILSERSEEVEMIKQEAALKRQADTVLHEVQKKKYEGKKMLNLLVALAKLRELRNKEEEKLGGYCSKQLTETFNKVMMRFQKLWEKQLEVYKLEEKGLKLMLEENTVPCRKDSKIETNLLQWEKVLFGDITNSENETLLTLPETDVQALIQVRRDWDQFLTTETTPMASSIPLGWVLPPETEDENWKIFTKSSKTVHFDL